MRRFTSSRPSWSASSTCSGVHRIETFLGPLRPGHRQQPVEIRADHRRLGVRVAHPLETGQLAFGLLPHRVGHAGVRNLLPVFVRNRAVVLAQLLANRVHLTAQEIFALLLLRAVLDVVVDALAHLQLCQPLALELERQLEPLDDVEGFEELQLLSEVQIGRIAGGIGQRAASVIDRTNARIRPSSPRSSRISSTTARYSRSSSRVRLALAPGRDAARSRRAARRPASAAAPPGSRDAAPSATPPARGRRAARARRLPRRPRRLAYVLSLPGHQEHCVVAAHVDRQRDRHPRKHHRVVQGNDSQPVHSATIIVDIT